MAKAANKLTARSVATLSEPGRHSDGGGLYLQVSPSGAKSWLFMFKRDGKRRELGLGSVRDVPPAEARQKAAEMRRRLLEGENPGRLATVMPGPLCQPSRSLQTAGAPPRKAGSAAKSTGPGMSQPVAPTIFQTDPSLSVCVRKCPKCKLSPDKRCNVSGSLILTA
ncbi:Arm DNA-binding domain-containing protein [Segnochrobactraceae bacterium EtOH-i3]